MKKPANPPSPVHTASPDNGGVALPEWLRWAIQHPGFRFPNHNETITQVLSDAFRTWAVAHGKTAIARQAPCRRDAKARLEQAGFRAYLHYISDYDARQSAFLSEYGVANYQGPSDLLLTTLEGHMPKVFVKKAPPPRPQPGTVVYRMSGNRSGIQIQAAGRLNVDFVPTNYAKNIADQFEPMAQALQATRPYGRFFLLEGPKGTGKTHFIEGLATSCKKTRFVFLTLDTGMSLGHPEILGTLQDFCSQRDGAVALIIEDADAMLAPKITSGSASSTILNMTGGTLGRMFDLRIIASTNEPKKALAIEEALTRNGRGNRRLAFAPLTPAEATGMMRQLFPGAQVEVAPKDKLFGSGDSWPRDPNCIFVPPHPIALCDLYRIAIDNGYVFPEKPEWSSRFRGDDIEHEILTEIRATTLSRAQKIRAKKPIIKRTC